jgi:hypothetical protein
MKKLIEIDVPLQPLYSTREIASYVQRTQRRVQSVIAEIPERTNGQISVQPCVYEGRTPFYSQEDMRRILVVFGYQARFKIYCVDLRSQKEKHVN